MTLSRLIATVPLLVACAERPDSPTAHLPACDGELHANPILESPHMPIGTEITWPDNPPTSGPHYPMWVGWDRHYPNLERPYWLHNVEHGGVAFLYSCPEACPEVVAQLVELVRSLPTDPHCATPLWTRVIIAADPHLPEGVTVAAVAWGYSYTASCFDEPSLRDFFDAHYGKAGENTCAEGLPFGGQWIGMP